jgi:hypothetical protein
MPSLSVAAALAGWLLLPALQMSREFACKDDTAAVRRLAPPNFRDCGHNLSGHPDSSASLVSSHVVGDHSEKWG